MKTLSFKTYCIATCLSVLALLNANANDAAPTATAASAQTEALKPLLIFGGEGNVAPNVLQLGNPSRWDNKGPKNGLGAINIGSVNVEPTKLGENNGIKINWTGGVGQIFSQSKSSFDRFDYLDADSALVFDAVVNKAPAGQVIMRVDCGYPCQGLVDATNMYKTSPIGQQIEVKIPLACFEKTGAKFGGINTPWLIWTDDAFSLSVANVRWVPGAAKDSNLTLKCGG